MIKPTRLKPMPIRVTPQQHAALNQLRAEDGASAQEHVRRAIDLYLAKKRREKGAGETTVPATAQPVVGAVPAAQQPVQAGEAKVPKYGYR